MHNLIKNTARVLSWVFSPIIVPTGCMVIAMTATPLAGADADARIMATLVVLLLTCLLPSAIIVALLRMGRVSDFDLSHRTQRTTPLIATVICYLLAFVYILTVHAPMWLAMFFAAGCAIAVVAGVISQWWKISIHGAGMGSLIGMLTVLAVTGLIDVGMLPWITLAIFAAGAVGSARVILERHSPAQVVCGVLMGAGLVILFMCWQAPAPMPQPAF